MLNNDFLRNYQIISGVAQQLAKITGEQEHAVLAERIDSMFFVTAKENLGVRGVVVHAGRPTKAASR